MIEPFYFGNSAKSLFGIYHPPKLGIARHAGVILCYPMGEEYIRSHRAFVRLAMHLSSAGFHTLRFDYYGCGDSEGDSDQGEIRQWLDDISTAIEELKGGSDVNQICLVGLRLGGSLALLAGAERGDIDGLVLWNPITSGRKYVEELITAYQGKARNFFPGLECRSREEGYKEALGFPLPDSMLKDLEKLDLFAIRQKPANKILFIESSDVSDDRRFREHLEGIGVSLRYKRIPGFEPWIARDDWGQGMVPIKVLQFVLSWISGMFP
jgi:pimeloyl-ACP methyl ester carboxylesterase